MLPVPEVGWFCVKIFNFELLGISLLFSLNCRVSTVRDRTVTERGKQYSTGQPVARPSLSYSVQPTETHELAQLALATSANPQNVSFKSQTTFETKGNGSTVPVFRTFRGPGSDKYPNNSY